MHSGQTEVLAEAYRLDDYSYGVRADCTNKDHSNPVAEPQPREDEFDYLLLESIDEALADLLGRRARDQIYDHLATRYRYGREEIPAKVPEFCGFLADFFASGSRTVERTILRRLSDRLGHEFVPVSGFDFSDYLAAFRARYKRDEERRRRTSPSGPLRP